MSLFDEELGNGRKWSRVGDSYEVTKKPRGVGRTTLPSTPFASMESIPQNGTYMPTFTMKAPEAINSGTYFERGDVLVSKITPSFENGKQALITDLPAAFGYATTEVIPLHPRSPEHDPRFLFFYLLHPDVRHYVAERMEGSTGRQRVPENVLLDLPIPALAYIEEARIADVLAMVKRASAIASLRERSSHSLKRAAMEMLFTRGLRGEIQKESEFGPIPANWDDVPLDSCAEVQTGATKGRLLAESVSIDVPYLRVANVQDGHLDLREVKTIRIRESELDRYRLQVGDVLLTEGGDFDKLGRGFIWRGELEVCVHQNHVFAVRTDRSRLLPEFLTYLAQSPYGKAYFLKVAHKTTNLASINSTKLKAFPVLVPPTLDEQREIVTILDALDRRVELQRRKRGVLDELFKALLHNLLTDELRVADLDLSALDRQHAEGTAA
jgi:type I restriction enzyme S subunit